MTQTFCVRTSIELAAGVNREVMENKMFRLCLVSVACYVQMRERETSVTTRSNDCTQFY